MRIIVFEQWERLLSLMRRTSRSETEDAVRYALVRAVPSLGRVQLADRAVNNVSVSGGVTSFAVPDIVPGKARDFILRVKAAGSNELAFTGAGGFEGETQDALLPPGDGETCLYLFSEVEGDVFLVSRKVVAAIAGGGTQAG